MEALELHGQADPVLPSWWRRRLGDWVETAGGGPNLVEVVVLAVGEALSNAVEHAYRDASPGPVGLRATLLPAVAPTARSSTEDLPYARARGGTRIEVEVIDHGRWQSPARDCAYRGRGLDVMRASADDVDLDATEEGTTVRMTWTLPDPA